MQATVNERIRHIANTVYSGNITAMAKATLISRTTINSIIGEKEVYPGYEVIRRIAEISSIDISLDWLITGKGEMLKSEQPTPMVSYSTGRPYYNVDFIGGFDIVLNDQTINPEYNIDFAPYNKEGVLWCNVTGHSMEPEIHHGDTMAIKKMNESNINYLPFGEVYAIVTDDYRTVKRISKADKEGFIKLVPSNKSPEYTPQDIPLTMIRAIYQVLVSVKRF